MKMITSNIIHKQQLLTVNSIGKFNFLNDIKIIYSVLTQKEKLKNRLKITNKQKINKFVKNKQKIECCNYTTYKYIKISIISLTQIISIIYPNNIKSSRLLTVNRW